MGKKNTVGKEKLQSLLNDLLKELRNHILRIIGKLVFCLFVFNLCCLFFMSFEFHIITTFM